MFYFKEFLLKENTYSENQSHYVSNIKLSDILTIENYKKLEDSEYIKKCLKIIFIPTKIDGVDCYEIKDVFNSNYRIYIDKNTGLNYKTIFDSTSQETENVSTIRTYEIIPEIVTDEDFQIENEEQFIKRN